MQTRRSLVRRPAALLFFFALIGGQAAPGFAQIFEATGERALGMGGAFVAVADDGTATYWNPAGLATGRTVDVGGGRASGEARAPAAGGGPAAAGTTGTSFYGVTPAFGFSVNILRGTEGGPSFSPTGAAVGGRQDLRPRVAGVRSLTTRQIGVSLVQSLLPGLVLGTTLKYVRATAGAGEAPADADPADLLSRASSLPGRASRALDADLGLMASSGAWRLGLTVRNLAAPEFAAAEGRGLRLHRQVRAGIAVTPGREALEHASGDGWLLALDADVTTTPTAAADRRMVAVGVERWARAHRVGLRAGARMNTAGARRPAVTAGLSVAPRAGLFLEAHVARGGEHADRGWGVGARAGF